MVQKETRAQNKPRGRPRGFEPDKALGSAQDAFWNAGFAATSLDDLSAATGLNRPSLYGAFGDKRALYLKALERSVDQTEAALRATLAPDASLRDGLQRVFAGSISIYMRGEEGARGCFIIGTAVVEAVSDLETKRALSAGLARIDKAFEDRFKLAVETGEAPADADPAGLAMVASALLNNLAIRARAGAPLEALQAVAKAGLGMLLPR